MEADVTVSAKLGSYEIDCTVLIGSDDYIKEQIFEQLKLDNPKIEEDESEIIWEVIDWEDLSEHSNLQDKELFEEIADYNGCCDLEVLNSAVECDIKISDVDGSYVGEFRNDGDFAENMAGQTCEIPTGWPFIHIDWEGAARDLMMDYSESNGHYFRNF
jgi:antirestriction protein